MSVTDEFLSNNAVYARSFKGPLPLPPGKHVAVVACMDARLDVYRLLGISEGEAHVGAQRGRGYHRRWDPLAGNQSAVTGHQGNHRDSPHRLRDADFHR